MELVSIVTFKVLGSCYISIKANLSKAVIAICSFNEPIRIPGTNAADNSKKTFSKCFSPTCKQYFEMFTLLFVLVT